MSPAANSMGEFLRARRELISPDEVGLRDTGRRRVAGLRREEIALLAGISTDYYVRLEQGRDRRPSTSVLDALAGALHLDAEATDHLHSLAHPAPGPARSRRAPERPPEGVTQLIAGWRETPAYIHGRYLDVLTANAMATALRSFCRPGVNLILATFLDPSVRDVIEDWDRATEWAVASLRAQASTQPDDPRLIEVVGELSVRSSRFRQLWARYDVRRKAPTGRTVLHHPQLGLMELRFEQLTIPDADGQTLVVHHAEPGTESAHKLALLASIVAGEIASDPLQDVPRRASRPVGSIHGSAPLDRSVEPANVEGQHGHPPRGYASR